MTLRRSLSVCALAAAVAVGCENSPTSPAVATVDVNPDSVSLLVGATSQLTVTPKDAGGNPLVGRSVYWQTSAPSVADVSSSGLVTALAVGRTTITATAEGKLGVAVITVGDVAAVDVTPSAASLPVGATTSLWATAIDVRGDVLFGRAVTWRSSAPSVVSVSDAGLISAVAVGSATITATVEGTSGTSAITVVPAPAPVPLALHYDGTGWTMVLEDVNGARASLGAIWGASASAVWAVGQSCSGDLMMHYDGTSWSSPPAYCVGTTLSKLTSIWGNSASDVYAAGAWTLPPSGGTEILHYDGQQWSTSYQKACSFWCFGGPRAVWSSSEAGAFAVGDSGLVLHSDGTGWNPQSSGTTATLTAVWGVGAGQAVFAVGGGGVILRYDGSVWATQSGGTTQTLHGVWGASATDIFAVGEAGTILHYDGAVWTPQSSGVTQALYGVWGNAGNDVFAVGDGGTILHYDGSTWTAQSAGASIDLRGVWGSSPVDVFAVGAPR